MNFITGNSISMGQKSLEFLWTKQRVTMNNIANVDTPGYKAQYVTFEEEFSSRLKSAGRTGSNNSIQDAINGSKYQINDTTTESARLDGNNVNTDSENVELARTSLQYQYVLNSVNSDITRFRTVIKGQ